MVSSLPIRKGVLVGEGWVAEFPRPESPADEMEESDSVGVGVDVGAAGWGTASGSNADGGANWSNRGKQPTVLTAARAISMNAERKCICFALLMPLRMSFVSSLLPIVNKVKIEILGKILYIYS